MDSNVMCGNFFLTSILCYWQKLPWILEETERNQQRLEIMKRIKKWIYMGGGGGGWGKVETINAIGFFHIKMTAEMSEFF